MINILSNPYIKYPLLGFYVVILGFTTGIGLLWGLPMLGFVPGPFFSYGMGLLLGCAVVYVIFFRWRAPRRTKLVAAAMILVVLGALGLLVASQGVIEGNKRVIELLGD